MRVCSVLSSSLRSHGLLLCSWILSGKKILEWLATSSSGRSSQSRDETHVSCVSCIGRQILYHWATWEAHSSQWEWTNPAYLAGCSNHRGETWRALSMHRGKNGSGARPAVLGRRRTPVQYQLRRSGIRMWPLTWKRVWSCSFSASQAATNNVPKTGIWLAVPDGAHEGFSMVENSL